jgi:hypothetical protein
VISGFNTDIEYEGVVYHVQTEDKGVNSPIILSLVYTGGTILASKRTPYNDLVEAGYDERVLTERVHRQHKLICAAIKAGRLDDLKKMSGKPVEAVSTKKPAQSKGKSTAPAATQPGKPEENKKPAPTETKAESAAAVDEAETTELKVMLLDEQEFHAGEWVVLKIYVGKGVQGGKAVSSADVAVKILGTDFRPVLVSTKTDGEGIAVVRAMLPHFTVGRAAILIQAISDGHKGELRRAIQRAQ